MGPNWADEGPIFPFIEAILAYCQTVNVDVLPLNYTIASQKSQQKEGLASHLRHNVTLNTIITIRLLLKFKKRFFLNSLRPVFQIE